MDSKIKQKIDVFFSDYAVREYDKGQILVHASDNPPGLIYLEKGQVRQYDISNSGEIIVVNVFKAPSFFPVSWLLNKTRNQYFLDAYTDVSIRTAPDDIGLKFLQDNTDVTLDLLGRVYIGLDGMKRRMTYLMGAGARSRVLYELIIECKRFGIKQANGSYILEMHEGELAARSGLARETVSRHLTKMGL